MGNEASKCEWRHAPEAHGGFGEFWRKLVELRPASGEDCWLSLAHRSHATGLCGGYHTCWGGCRWNSQNRNNVYLSPYVEEPLNSKIIKSFIPEQRSRKCFSCFEIPMFYIYICTFHISISWLWYIGNSKEFPKSLLPSASIVHCSWQVI